jgi:HSP20 family molecular chaperone IbpA
VTILIESERIINYRQSLLAAPHNKNPTSQRLSYFKPPDTPFGGAPGLISIVSDPFRSLRREMEDMFRMFDRNLPSLNVGAGVPTIDVAETTDAIEVSAELPGVDEKDIKISLDATGW